MKVFVAISTLIFVRFLSPFSWKRSHWSSRWQYYVYTAHNVHWLLLLFTSGLSLCIFFLQFDSLFFSCRQQNYYNILYICIYITIREKKNKFLNMSKYWFFAYEELTHTHNINIYGERRSANTKMKTYNNEISQVQMCLCQRSNQ